MGVLKLNNRRDMENDRRCGKRTIPVIIGIKRAKIYQFALIIAAFVCMTIYTVLHDCRSEKFLFLLTLPIFVLHLKQVAQSKGRALDAQLKVVSLSTLLFALLG